MPALVLDGAGGIRICLEIDIKPPEDPAHNEKAPAEAGAFPEWSRWESNPRPPRCERGALPAELLPHRRPRGRGHLGFRPNGWCYQTAPARFKVASQRVLGGSRRAAFQLPAPTRHLSTTHALPSWGTTSDRDRQTVHPSPHPARSTRLLTLFANLEHGHAAPHHAGPCREYVSGTSGRSGRPARGTGRGRGCARRSADAPSAPPCDLLPPSRDDRLFEGRRPAAHAAGRRTRIKGSSIKNQLMSRREQHGPRGSCP